MDLSRPNAKRSPTLTWRVAESGWSAAILFTFILPESIAVPRWFPVGMGIVCGAGLFGYASLLVPGVHDFLSGERTTFPGTDVPMTSLSYLPAISLIVGAPSVVLASVLFGYATRGDCARCRVA